MLYIPLRIPLRQVLLRYLNLSAFEKTGGGLAIAIRYTPQQTRHFLPFFILFCFICLLSVSSIFPFLFLGLRKYMLQRACIGKGGQCCFCLRASLLCWVLRI